MKGDVEDFTAGGVVLARALGAVHGAVALTLLGIPGLGIAGAALIGFGAFILIGRIKSLPPRETAMLGYAGPVGAAAIARLFDLQPSDWHGAGRDAGRFLLATWNSTPSTAHFLCLAFALARAKKAVFADPFTPPGT